MEFLKEMELNFDVENDNYLQFIQDLRDTAKDPGKLSHGRPILPSRQDADGQHISVKLQVGGLCKVTLRIGRFDLRLMVYIKTDGSLVHVNDFDVYDNIVSLDFGGEQFFVRRSTLVDAVEFLADPEKDITDLKEKDKVRSSLLVLRVLICEGAKLSALALVFSNVFKTGHEVLLHPWMSRLISDWEYLSIELLGQYHDEEDDCDYYLINTENEHAHCCERRVIGTTCQDMARCIGILPGIVVPPEAEFFEVWIEEPAEGGECMLELYSVLIYIHGGKSGGVYGTIEVKDNTTPCSYNIYHRDSTDCEYIESNGTLTLEGPSGFLDASDLVEMKLDLMERDTSLPISKGKMYWRNDKDKYDPDFLFDTRHTVVVKGEIGYAIVFYTVFKKAVVATIEATLERGTDGGACGDDICVSGSIFARSEIFNYSTEHEQKYYRSLLFRESYDKGKGKLVKLGFPMSLSKEVVAVDTRYKFTIEAKLQNSVGEQLVAGSVAMKPQNMGTSENVIGKPSDSYFLRLRVSWKKKTL